MRKNSWGTEMDLDASTAQKVLNGSTRSGGQRYGWHGGRLYEFQYDNAGAWHGYPIPGNKAPTSVLRGLRAQGIISNSEYNAPTGVKCERIQVIFAAIDDSRCSSRMQ